MDLQRKKDIIIAGFGFDKLTISEVVELCLKLDSDETIAVLKDIESEYADEI